MGKGRTLERKRRVRPKAWSKNSELHAEGRRVPKRREVSRESLTRRKRRKHKRVGGRQGSSGGSGKPRLHSKSGQTRNGKGGWKTKGQLIRWHSEIGQGDS